MTSEFCCLVISTWKVFTLQNITSLTHRQFGKVRTFTVGVIFWDNETPPQNFCRVFRLKWYTMLYFLCIMHIIAVSAVCTPCCACALTTCHDTH